VTISLTVLMEEETLYDDLRTGNVCTLLIELDNDIVIVNPGGTPSILEYNIKKLINTSEKNVKIIITTFIPRYWSALIVIHKFFNIDNVLIPQPCTYVSHRLIRYLSNIGVESIEYVSNSLIDNDICLINIKSSTYKELIITIKNTLLISTPGLWMLQNYNSDILRFLEYSRYDTYVGGVPLLPHLVRDHLIVIKRFFSKFRKLYIGNIRTASSRKVLDRLSVDVKVLRVGYKVHIC